MAVVDMGIYGQCIGQETLTVSNSVKTLTTTKYSNILVNSVYVSARVAFITVDGTAGTNDIRYTLEGTDPVGGTTGHLLLSKSDGLIVRGKGNIANLKMIREANADTVIHVSYFV